MVLSIQFVREAELLYVARGRVGEAGPYLQASVMDHPGDFVRHVNGAARREGAVFGLAYLKPGDDLRGFLLRFHVNLGDSCHGLSAIAEHHEIRLVLLEAERNRGGPVGVLCPYDYVSVISKVGSRLAR